MSTANIRIIDEINVIVGGITIRHHKTISDRLAVMANNYFFNPRYKLKRWDGKVRFYSEHGATFLFLLRPVLQLLRELGYTATISDERTSTFQLPDPIDDQYLAQWCHIDTDIPIILRDYQVLAVNALLSAGQGICLASTGSGKTLITAALIRAFHSIGKRVLVIVPDGVLIRQTKAEIENIKLDVGAYSGTEKSPDSTHVVSTWQSLKNNPMIVSMFDVVIVDECHGLKAATLQKILIQYCPTIAYRYGLTGTLPEHEDAKLAVHVAVGEVLFEVPAHELIDRGVLSSLEIHMMRLTEDLTAQYAEHVAEAGQLNFPPTEYKSFKEGYFGDHGAEVQYLSRKESRIEWIARFIQQLRDKPKGNTLVLVNSVPMCRILAKLIPNSVVVNGTDVKKIKDREGLYAEFKHKDDVVMIATVQVAGTGLNIKRIFNLVFLDIGKSFTRVIQAVGRGLRTDSDKDHVDTYDVFSDLKYSQRHAKKRIAFYRKAKYSHKVKAIEYETDQSC